MRGGLSFRPYREGDEEGIYNLHQAALPPERQKNEWMRWWYWLYKENPAGEGLIWLAEVDNRIVGQHSLIPLKIKMGNREVLSSWGVDAMTHPDYRRRGIFETISQNLFSDAVKNGITISTGFPNEYSRPGLIKKLGWFDVSHISVKCKPLNWNKTIRILINSNFLSVPLSVGTKLILDKFSCRTDKMSLPGDVVITRIYAFDERFDRLWSRVSEQFNIMVIRNSDYLNWRYRVPGKQYLIYTAEKNDEVSGYIVLRIKAKRNMKASVVFDMIAESEDIMYHLVLKAIESSRLAGADCIVYSLIANRAYHSILKRAGFISIPFNHAGHFCLRQISKEIPVTLLRDPGNWFVQVGDSDEL